MKLTTNCNKCNKEISFLSQKKDRRELAKQKGENLELSCNHCDQTDVYHVNKIYAAENRKFSLFAAFAFLIGTPLVFYLIWDYLFQFSQIYVIAGMVAITGFPFIVYSIIEKEQRNKVKRFNSYRLRA
jgi:hypothetical protein